MSSEYLRLNPKHKVPLLSVDDVLITENVAILQWIARQFPKAKLMPTRINEFRAISLMSWCASGIHPTLTPNIMPQKYCDLPGSEENVRQCAHKVMHEAFGIAEGLLDGRKWFFESFTIPDIYFFWCFRRAIQFQLDVSEYRSCSSHFDRVSARPSVQALVEFEAEVLRSYSAD